MKFHLQNSLQHKIADLLWTAKSEDVTTILSTYGNDAHIVYNMMIATFLDDIDDTEMACSVLQNIFYH